MTELPQTKPTPVSVPSAAPAPPQPASDPVAALSNSMAKLGLDVNQYKLSYSEQRVWYPGGSYVDRQITVSLPNGKSERFDAGLVGANPGVAAVEIARMAK